MVKKGPKTSKGLERKLMTGDGRKSTPMEKVVKEANKAAKEANKAMEEAIYGKKKKKRK